MSVPVEFVTVDPRATAVVAETTTWAEFPQLWGRLLGEVYEFVRSRPELGTGGEGERWQNVMLYKDQRPGAVRAHAAACGRELAGPCWEIYGHWREDPSELETEVFWLLR